MDGRKDRWTDAELRMEPGEANPLGQDLRLTAQPRWLSSSSSSSHGVSARLQIVSLFLAGGAMAIN